MASLALAACDTAEERAEKHYENGLALLEEGDLDRALLEFRNVFQLNESHEGARLAFAQTQEQRGNIPDAYGHYLRLVEQNPEHFDGRRALARLAVGLNNWDEAERHVSVAQELQPDDLVVQSVRAGVDYRNAMRNSDTDTARLAVTVSQTLIQEDGSLSTARMVVIDDLLRREDWRGALAAIDDGLDSAPEDIELYRLRLGVLEQLGLEDEIVAQLREMDATFPDQNMHLLLIRRYVVQDRLDAAEAYLRERAAGGDSDAQIELIGFLSQRISIAAAIEEIDRILTTGPGNATLLQSLRAGLNFESGNRDEAIVAMQDLLEGAEPSEETDRIRVALAQMLIQTGNSVGARAEVETVLEHDPSQVEALKMKAGWLIEDDQPGDAILELRTALDQAPRDAELMTLMAQAHERSGNRDLMGEMLALAVDASNSAPAETLRYAQFLVQDAKLLPAEDILIDALRLDSANPQLLAALGNLYLRMEDWPRNQQVIDRLRRIGTEETIAMADDMTARQLAGRNQAEQLESFLSGLAESEEGGLQAAAAIIRLRLAQGDIEGASAYADELLTQEPNNPTLLFIKAGTLIADGRQEEAIGILDSIVDTNPQAEQVWVALYQLHLQLGDRAAADDVLTQARAALPNSGNLRWIAASEAERVGDIDGAIAIYEELYAANSNSLIIANNLASLISTHRTDQESLERAFAIARRLRGTDVPAFQDTYGWIAHRLGDHDEALSYLEPAAEGLGEDPKVQYHLGEAYLALGREADALAQFQRAAELMQNLARLTYMDRVESEITRLVAGVPGTED
ncbi:MAG: tetratricopeptide repeat protein [Rhodobacteraceae bacterium]|nr:tetratricopeptide repeat protein [Paracoccaceae bacterium]